MKTGNFTRKVDELGRIVFPIEIRKKMDIAAGDNMNIYMQDNSIVIKKDGDECALCGGAKNLTEFGKRHICSKCMKEIKEI